ncbi:hypothetical protein NC651_025576 [Populus alba x Populus x berolinensis]|nr:hypothetical protein NC651_025576 [Populus alba x Populus x berolinensis]
MSLAITGVMFELPHETMASIENMQSWNNAMQTRLLHTQNKEKLAASWQEKRNQWDLWIPI